MPKSMRREWGGAGSRQARTISRRRPARPRIETLEDRQLLATLSWTGIAAFDVGDSNWSNSANWSPEQVPNDGDALDFSDTALDFTSNNNISGLALASITFSGSGYDLTGSAVKVGGAGVSTTATDTISFDLTLTANTSFAVNDAKATLTLAGAVTAASGTPSLTKSGPGALILSSASSSVLAATVTSGILTVDGTLGASTLNGGTLGGSGTVGAITSTATGGTVAPGNSPGILNSGSVVFNSATIFDAEIDGNTPGVAGYDQLNVTGTVTLGNATLGITLGAFVPSEGNTFTIINNDLADPVVGTFSGLPQAATITLGATTFVIDYAGGDGNDVVLTAIGELVARNDVYSLPEYSTLSVPPTGILTNDSFGANTVAPVLVNGPAFGTLNLFTDGSFSYTPAPGFSGTDAFTYFITDGGTDSNTATVTLFVNEVILPPVSAGDAYTGLADTDIVVADPGVLGNDYSPQGGSLFAELLANATQGVVNLAIDGSFTYTPNPGFVGTDTFTYRARDTNGLASGDNPATTVTLTIGVLNIAPVAVDDAFGMTEDTSLIVAGPGVLANDTDANISPTPDTLTAIIVTGPAHGSLDLSSTGQFVYTPDANYFGTDTFTYRATDGQLLSNVATVTITIAGSNDPPVGTDDAYSVNEDTPLGILAPGVLVNDTDADGDVLTAVLVNGVQHGTLLLDPTGAFTYTPDANYFGTDTFTYRASDGNPGGLSGITTVTITVNAVPDAPVAADDAFTTNGNTTLAVASPGVLFNDTDADGPGLSSVLISGPLHGSLMLNGDGSFVYTPNSNYFGSDTFTYRASDGVLFSGVATVSLTIVAAPLPPVSTNDVYSGAQGATITVLAPGVLGNDTDANGDPLTAVLVNGTQHAISFVLNANGSFTYTPDPTFFGVDTFTYQASDGTPGGLSQIATVTLKIGQVNIAPVAVADAYGTNEDTPISVSAPGVLINDTDANGDALSAVLATGPLHGSVLLNSDGSFVYTPTANFSGTDTFTYRVGDGKLFSAPATVTITVVSVPEAPVANNDAYTGVEDTTLSIAAPGILLNDLNPDNLPLTVIVINGPQHASAFVANNNGSFTYTPSANFFGADAFSYYLQSGALTSNLATVSLTILPVNDGPVAVDDAFSTSEDVTLVVATPGVLLNDFDSDGNTLSAVLASGPLHGSVALHSDGSFVYIPNANYNGTDNFTYRASDGFLFSNLATVTITVFAVNDAPVAANDIYTIQQDQNLYVVPPGILANDSDTEGSPLTAVLVNPPLNGTLVIGADGGFLYTPNLGYHGTDTFTYRANDGVLFSNLATVTIVVTPVAPTTVRLDSLSDTGYSNSDNITYDNTPTFVGTTSPNLTVYLLARASGSAVNPTTVGRTVADAAGNYAVNSIQVADGTYDFFVQAVRADGLSTGLISAGQVMIDTAGPRINSALLNPRTGQVLLVYQDDRSGMYGASMGNRLNYTLTRASVANPRQYVFSAARAFPGNGATQPQTVLLVSAQGKVIPHGRYQFSVNATGVTDLAGNVLDGEFSGTLPSGDGIKGGNFNAQFLNGDQNLRGPSPYTKFIPPLTGLNKPSVRSAKTAKVAKISKALPAGPLNYDNLFK